jgi:NADH-quinone oxidoreductase subunit E
METDVKKYQELEAYINELEAKPEELIAILHRAQHIFGYLPREVQEFIADKLHINVSKVYGVVTFYSFFTMEKKGKYVINVCLGTACFVRGADKILKEFESKLGIKNGETTADGKFTLSSLRCVGACGLAPVVQVNDKTYGNVTIEDVAKILEEYSKEED